MPQVDAVEDVISWTVLEDKLVHNAVTIGQRKTLLYCFKDAIGHRKLY